MADTTNTADAAPVNTYHVGELTLLHVFHRAGLTNVSDIQAVLDATEAALAYKNEVYREMVAAKNAEIEAARYEDRA